MPENKSKGNLLLSFINGMRDGLKPFLLKNGEEVDNSHTNYWESLQIAKTFLDLNYCVDVIDYNDKTFVPEKDYSFFVGARTNFETFAQLLNRDCIKILHTDTAHWMFNNYALYVRCLGLQKRKNVSIKVMKQRMVEYNLAIEYADYATIKGNQFTINTYSYAQKPYFRIYNPACITFQWPENKNYEACRKNFLWFSSSGLVHKGLDLVLDTFAEMPDYHLTVCGPIHEEKDFEDAYYKELYRTPNIHTVGWVDIDSHQFIEIINRCIGLIYPSCAEGQAGSVVNCMQAGLIPIVSYESGMDVDDFGVILKDCTINQIENSIQMISNLSVQELKQRARKTWEYSREKHTRERYAQEYRKIIQKIIADYNTKLG